MGVQNRPFRPLGPTVMYANNTVAQTIDLNYNNGTRTIKITNEASSVKLHYKRADVGGACTTTNGMSVLETQTEYVICPNKITQLSVVSSGSPGAQGWHITIGDGGT